MHARHQQARSDETGREAPGNARLLGQLVTSIDPIAYGRLLAAELPQPIRNARDFDRVVVRLEELEFPSHPISAEEEALREILAALIEAYDEKKHQLPDQPAHLTVRFLMD